MKDAERGLTPRHEGSVVRLHGGAVLEASNPHERRSFRCRFIRSGEVRAAGNQASNLVVETAAVREAVQAGLFTGLAVFVDHAGMGAHPSLRDLAGVTVSADWDEADGSAGGVIRFYETESGAKAKALLEEILTDREAGEPVPDIGLSLVFWPEWAPAQAGEPRRIRQFRHIESIDLVFEPAADGRILSNLGSKTARAFTTQGGAQTMDEKEESRKHEGTAAVEPARDELAQAQQMPGDTAQGWLAALSASGAQAMIAASGLPEASRQRLTARTYAAPEEVNAAIEQERGYLAALAESHVIQLPGSPPRSPQISLGRTGFEQVQLAAEALIAGVRPPEGIVPLSGIRELYTLLSGDYEMTGLFHPDRVRFANVSSSTMAGLVANALNKRVVNLFQEYPRWWEPIVSEEDFTSLQQAKWITLGGVGALPTVSEGAAYTELSWDDKTETADFVKKGGYLGITIEAIDKDDTRKLQAAPRALAQAAWLALGTAISSIFTSNSGTGPVLADMEYLFHSSRGNVGATALSFSAWSDVRTAMRKYTELNSGSRLGALTAPKFLLVPPDLETTALQVLASELQPAQENFSENPFSDGDTHTARLAFARARVIVVDLWTDANDWAAVCDPRLYPTIGVGYRYGRSPEIFSVASPTAGLMFTNDVMPVKVRFFYAVGAMDWRGMYKQNVA